MVHLHSSHLEFQKGIIVGEEGIVVDEGMRDVEDEDDFYDDAYVEEREDEGEDAPSD